ncbi:MAG: prolipoprotein diacylglyceryl transferase [Nanoarchaeota archaeon]|nr:prolipoprotein diacylglyceryl transferase [Nanoarchaeota archaeon]
MFVNSIDPVIVHLGPFEVRYYGIIYAFGFVITYLFLRKWSKEGRLALNENQLDSLLTWLLVGVVAGARFFEFVFYNPSVFWTDPLEILKVWHGGLSFHGGLIGATAAIWMFSRKHKISMLKLLDAIAIPAILGLALGRIANFTNQELVGPIANVPWCVVFTAVDDTCRHPYQIYASISHLILFFILLKIYKKQTKEGTTFWSFVTGYGVLRFITDFWRVDPRIYGISMGQFLSAMMAIVGSIYRVRLKKKNKEVIFRV